MTDKAKGIAAAVAGAAVGAAAGYMFFTERGRMLRRQLEPAIEDLARELAQFRGTVNRAVSVANEGWQVLNEAIGDGGTPARFSNPHQTTPF